MDPDFPDTSGSSTFSWLVIFRISIRCTFIIALIYFYFSQQYIESPNVHEKEPCICGETNFTAQDFVDAYSNLLTLCLDLFSQSPSNSPAIFPSISPTLFLPKPSSQKPLEEFHEAPLNLTLHEMRPTTSHRWLSMQDVHLFFETYFRTEFPIAMTSDHWFHEWDAYKKYHKAWDTYFESPDKFYYAHILLDELPLLEFSNMAFLVFNGEECEIGATFPWFSEHSAESSDWNCENIDVSEKQPNPQNIPGDLKSHFNTSSWFQNHTVGCCPSQSTAIECLSKMRDITAGSNYLKWVTSYKQQSEFEVWNWNKVMMKCPTSSIIACAGFTHVDFDQCNEYKKIMKGMRIIQVTRALFNSKFCLEKASTGAPLPELCFGSIRLYESTEE